MYESMKVVEAVRAIVAENPETVYEQEVHHGCLYTKGKGGNGYGCLIGQAMIRAYPELEDKLRDIDDKINPAAGTLIHNHLHFTETIGVAWLSRVQSSQDKGEKWQDCVKIADEEYPLTN